MSEQGKSTGITPESESSDAMKQNIENPSYTEKTPEDVGNSDGQKQELGAVIEQNKEAIKAQEKASEVIQNQSPSQQAGATDDKHTDDQSKEEIKHNVQKISEVENAEEQVEKIINLATSKDPYFAIKVAQKLDDNFVLDMVHDELIEDKVRKVLLDKGLLKEN